MTRYKLGFNLICAGNRFPEPEEWGRVAREEMDVDYIQLSADVVDPRWPDGYLNQYIDRVLRVKEKYGLSIHSVFTGTFSRRHLFLHPDREIRQWWYEWYQALIRFGAAVGACSAGSHFGILTKHDNDDDRIRHERIKEGIRLWKELSVYAGEQGLDHLFIETMSIDREMANTIDGAEALFHEVNQNSAIPIKLCLDVGHAPHPDERDPYEWLRRLARYASVIHLQQTDANNSRHWPFTSDYNQVGIIDPIRILDTINESGLEEANLIFEIAHREYEEYENRVISDLRESATYWRQFLADETRFSIPEEKKESMP